MTVLLLSLIWMFCFMFFFPTYVLWEELLVLCWIRHGKTGHPYLVPDIRGKAFCFYCWEWCYLWAFYCHLYYIEIISFSSQVCWELLILKRYWILSNTFSFIYWNDYVIFILCSVNVICYINWFLYVEPSMHPRNKSDLAMVFDHL